MIQFDAGTLDFITVLLLVVVAFAISAFTGYMSNAGWRSSARRDMELYEMLKRNADSPKDYEALEILKDSAVSTVVYKATLPKRTIDRLRWLSTEFMPLTMWVPLLPLFLGGLVFRDQEWIMWASVALMAACLLFDVTSIYRKHRDAKRRRDGAEHDEPEREDHDGDDEPMHSRASDSLRDIEDRMAEGGENRRDGDERHEEDPDGCEEPFHG